MIYCRKKELKKDDPLVRWSKKRGSDLRWVKAEGMSEEKLGMGKNEIGDVLKVCPTCPAYSQEAIFHAEYGLIDAPRSS